MTFCPHCGKEQQEGGAFCSGCGKSFTSSPAGSAPAPKKGGSKLKKFAFGIIGLFVLLIAIGAIFGDSSSSTASKPSSTAAKNKEPEYNYVCNVEGIGKIKGSIASKVGVAIADVKSVDSIDAPFSSTHAQGVFKVVTIVASNNQKDAITLDANSFKLIDDQGREFSHSIEGDTALQMKGNESLFLKKLNPDLTLSGKISFDVPPSANIVKLTFRGGMSGDKGEVPFKIMKAE